MPAFDFALGLRMHGRTANVRHAFIGLFCHCTDVVSFRRTLAFRRYALCGNAPSAKFDLSGARCVLLRDNRERSETLRRAQRCKVDGAAYATGRKTGKAQCPREAKSEDRPDETGRAEGRRRARFDERGPICLFQTLRSRLELFPTTSVQPSIELSFRAAMCVRNSPADLWARMCCYVC